MAQSLSTVSVLVVASVVITWLRARWLFKITLLALGLLLLQIALGAITVKVDLQYWAVVPHLGTAMTILGTRCACPRAASRERGGGVR